MFTSSGLFGPLSASKSKLSSENELKDVSYVCSQLHAIQPNSSRHSIQPTSSRHSIHPNSSRHSIRQDSIHHESTTCQWYKDVHWRRFLSFRVSGFTFSRPEIPVLDVLPLHEPLAPLDPVDCPLGFPLAFFTLSLCLHSWTMTCSACLCQAIACRCSCLHCSLVENVLLRTENNHRADLMTLFLCLTRERELTAPTSSGSECSRKPVSLGLESRILKPNFASTYVTISRRASFKSSQAIGVENQVLLKLLRHQHFQASQLDLLVARHIGLPAFNSRSSRREHRPREMIVRGRFRFLPPVVGSSFLQPPPCLQWVLPRVGNNVIRLVTGESH